MSITLKILQMAIAKKDFDFLAGKAAEKLLELGWSHDDIAAFAAKLAACRR